MDRMGAIKDDIKSRASKYAGGVGVLDYIEIKGIDFVFSPYVIELEQQLEKAEEIIGTLNYFLITDCDSTRDELIAAIDNYFKDKDK